MHGKRHLPLTGNLLIIGNDQLKKFVIPAHEAVKKLLFHLCIGKMENEIAPVVDENTGNRTRLGSAQRY